VIFVAERQFFAKIEKHFSPDAIRFGFADLFAGVIFLSAFDVLGVRG